MTGLNKKNKNLLEQIEDNTGKTVLEPGYCASYSNYNNTNKFWRRTFISPIKKMLRPLYHRWQRFAMSKIFMMRKDYQGIVYVTPLEIKMTVNNNDSTLKGNNLWHFGSVRDGDWDLDGIPIQNYGNIYPILKQRVEMSMNYHDIPEFIENLKLIYQGETPDNCRSEEQYREKWCRIEILYNLIKNEGYKSQEELKTGCPFNEIRVQVGRNGKLLFEEGIHRLVICQVLGLKRVPVIVTRRHSQWVKTNKKSL